MVCQQIAAPWVAVYTWDYHLSITYTSSSLCTAARSPWLLSSYKLAGRQVCQVCQGTPHGAK
jgi:hypothetical protein